MAVFVCCCCWLGRLAFVALLSCACRLYLVAVINRELAVVDDAIDEPQAAASALA